MISSFSLLARSIVLGGVMCQLSIKWAYRLKSRVTGLTSDCHSRYSGQSTPLARTCLIRAMGDRTDGSLENLIFNHSSNSLSSSVCLLRSVFDVISVFSGSLVFTCSGFTVSGFAVSGLAVSGFSGSGDDCG